VRMEARFWGKIKPWEWFPVRARKKGEMRVLGCPYCDRNFEPEGDLFCSACKEVTPHYSHLANRLRGGNNYRECAMCGCETTEELSRRQHGLFEKLGKKYETPESY